MALFSCLMEIIFTSGVCADCGSMPADVPLNYREYVIHGFGRRAHFRLGRLYCLAMFIAMTNWLLFIGRFHPVLVHLPIGIMVLLAILELVGIRPNQRETIAEVRGLVVPILAVCAVIAATCGWLLATGGDYNPTLLFWHRWLGITVAGLCVVMFIEIRFKVFKAYWTTLAIALVAVAITGHLGGSMTYGSNYLTQYAPRPIKRLLGVEGSQSPVPLPKISNVEDAIVYPQIVQAIFNQNCIACHGVNRQKGGLRLDSYQWLLRGAHGKPMVLPGNAARSILIERIELPIGKGHRMPPSGHRQLTRGEKAILSWWVQNGAVNQEALNKTNPPEPILADIRSLFAVTASRRPLSRLKVKTYLAQLVRQTGMRIAFAGKHSAMLRCSAEKDAHFSNKQLEMLRPIRLNIASLNLDSTGVTDSAVALINQMVNLTSLHLRDTPIDAKGLLLLDALNHLKYLSVPTHKVTAAEINALKKRNFTPHLVVTGDGGISDLPSF